MYDASLSQVAELFEPSLMSLARSVNSYIRLGIHVYDALGVDE